MPIPLPNDRAMVWLIYEDASAVAAALHRLWMEFHRVAALRDATAQEYPEAALQLRQRITSGEGVPLDALMRITPYLDGPSRGDTPEQRRQWFRATLAPLIERPGNSIPGILNYHKQRALDLRDAAARKLNELSDAGPVSPAKIEPPVVCTQAAVLKWYGKDENTAGFIKTLQSTGEVSRFERAGRKYRIWFADPERHRQALAEIGEGPKPPRS
jgi:hypothetical protein